MPVVAAARLKGHVGQKNRAFLRVVQRIQIGISRKIIRKRGIVLSESEHILLIKHFFIAYSHIVLSLVFYSPVILFSSSQSLTSEPSEEPPE